MRTTLTLDPDVAAKAKEGAARFGKPFKEIVNAALRAGLDSVLNPAPSKPYKTHPHPMGLKPGLNYDNISELLALSEGDALSTRLGPILGQIGGTSAVGTGDLARPWRSV